MTLRLLPLLGLTALLGCASGPSAPEGAGAAALEGPLDDTSIYLYDAVWETDAGDSLALAELRGRPVALAMVYADCGTACPLIVHDMGRIGQAAEGVPLRYVLVTLDPERDTPERLRSFRQMHRLGDDWLLLRGTPDDVQVLAALLSVRYRADADGTIAHSNLITLLDPGGSVVARQEGLGTDPSVAASAL